MGAEKSLARPGRKQATATDYFDFHISCYNHNLRNISTIYILFLFLGVVYLLAILLLYYFVMGLIKFLLGLEVGQ